MLRGTWPQCSHSALTVRPSITSISSLARVAMFPVLAHIVGSLNSQGRDQLLCTASRAPAGSGLWGRVACCSEVQHRRAQLWSSL